jgi:anti-anti-sigma factor
MYRSPDWRGWVRAGWRAGPLVGSADRASTPLVVTTTFRDVSVEVVVVGDVDLASGRQLRSIILGIAQPTDVIRIDVDGRGIRFIDSGGLTVLEDCKAECWGNGVDCFLGPLSPALRQLLSWTVVRGSLHDPQAN